MTPKVRALWHRTRLAVRRGPVWLVEATPDEARKLVRDAFAVIYEGPAIAIVVSKRTKKSSGPYRIITFEVDLAPDVVGYFAPAAERLAAAGVPIVPICGFRHDHVLVRAADVKRAIAALKPLTRPARRPV